MYEGVDVNPNKPDLIGGDIAIWDAESWKSQLDKAESITPELEREATKHFSQDVIDRNYNKFKSIRDIADYFSLNKNKIDKYADEISALKSNSRYYYDEKIHLVGGSVSTEDLKNVISRDSTKVNLIAVAAIFAILLISMHSLKLPVLLTMCIEGSIWISMSLSTLRGDWLFYIGYLIVSSILLGSTVDYAILVSNRYIEFRKHLDVDSAIKESIAHSAVSIMTSGLILIMAGILLSVICSDQLTAQLGGLLARGTFTAIIVVLFALPGFLKITADRK